MIQFVEGRLERRRYETLEATIELLIGLFLIAVILIITLSIVGSVVAALRAVSRGNCHLDTYPRHFGDCCTPSSNLYSFADS
jgi:hypothetical protein